VSVHGSKIVTPGSWKEIPSWGVLRAEVPPLPWELRPLKPYISCKLWENGTSSARGTLHVGGGEMSYKDGEGAGACLSEIGMSVVRRGDLLPADQGLEEAQEALMYLESRAAVQGREPLVVHSTMRQPGTGTGFGRTVVLEQEIAGLFQRRGEEKPDGEGSLLKSNYKVARFARLLISDSNKQGTT